MAKCQIIIAKAAIGCCRELKCELRCCLCVVMAALFPEILPFLQRRGEISYRGTSLAG